MKRGSLFRIILNYVNNLTDPYKFRKFDLHLWGQTNTGTMIFPTSKLKSRKIIDGNEVAVYRHPIIAGMEFCYSTGKIISPSMRQVGYYDYTIITSHIGETLSEKSGEKVFFNN